MTSDDVQKKFGDQGVMHSIMIFFRLVTILSIGCTGIQLMLPVLSSRRIHQGQDVQTLFTSGPGERVGVRQLGKRNRLDEDCDSD